MKHLALIALAIAGCSAEEPGVTLQLVPDPSLASAQSLAATLATIELVADSDEGLYAPSDARAEGAVRIEDADADPSSLELVATVPVDGHLPTMRLDRGSLPDMALDLTVTGLDDRGVPAAVGAVRGVELGSSDEPVLVPFNPLPTALPPRVVEIVPGVADVAIRCTVPAVILMFSKAIDVESVVTPGAITLEPDTGGFDIAVDTSQRVVRLLLRNALPGEDMVVRYRIRVDTTVVDEQGRSLDQVPAQEGNQPFDESVAVPCPGGPPPSNPDTPCGDGVSFPLTPECPGRGRLACVDGACVPSACETAACDVGFACSESSLFCEPDCRPYLPFDVCNDDLRCDETTGACGSP